MNSLNNLPLSYIYISVFLSGFTFYAFIKFLYIYIKRPRNEYIYIVLFSLSASIYISANSVAVIYYILTGRIETARYFVLARELSTMIFIIAIPFMTRYFLTLKNHLAVFNSILLRSGLFFSTAVLLVSLYNPALLIGAKACEIHNNFLQVVLIQNITPLLIIKNSLLILYMVYSVIIFLYSKIVNRTLYPVTKIILSLIVLLYFALSALFQVFFFGNNPEFLNNYLPYLDSGISIFLLFNIFGFIDIMIYYSGNLIKIEKNLKRIVYEDTMIGIPNRNGFMNDLQAELYGNSTFTLILIDIDDFQNINESFGEKTGDEILKLLSLRMHDLFAAEGRFYRIGGDDFIFFLKKIVSDEDAGSLCGKIISSLRNPFKVFGVSYTVTVSIGVVHVPADGNDPNSILNNAYSAVRSAKQTKNTFRIFSAEMAYNSSKKIGMVNLLRSSIDMDQFNMFYQPVVDASGDLVYAEALLRCTNPDLAIGGPGEFIPLMEKAGLIRDIDNMVIRKTLHDMEMHIGKRFGISINLSSNQLVNRSYSNFLLSFAAQHRIEPELIILEITENTLIENLTAGKDSILRLKEKGFKIAIDDFGKGFSSLSYLSELPVDILKIDMAFAESIPGDPKKEAVVSGIITLSHSLGLKVVAEGLETASQFDFFKDLGCDNFQGYHFSHPVPLDDLLKKYSL